MTGRAYPGLIESLARSRVEYQAAQQTADDVAQARRILETNPPEVLSSAAWRKLTAGLLARIPNGFGPHDDRCAIRKAQPCNCPLANLRRR